GRCIRSASSVYGGVNAYDRGETIESRHPSTSCRTTSSSPPRPCARMDTAICTRTFIESAQEAGESNPSNDASSDGQSGRLDGVLSPPFINSPCSTATLANFV